MKQLSNYLRLKEIDRIEAEKKCLINLKKVIDICIKRDYNFSIHQSEGNSNIYLTTDGHATSISAYFKGNLINYSDKTGTMTMIQLLQKLRENH